MFSSPKNRTETEHNRFDIKNRRPTPPDAQQKLIANMQRAAAQSDAPVSYTHLDVYKRQACEQTMTL